MAPEGEAPVPVRKEGRPAAGAARNGAHPAPQRRGSTGIVGKFVRGVSAGGRC